MPTGPSLLTDSDGDLSSARNSCKAAARALADAQTVVEAWQHSARRSMVRYLTDRHGFTQEAAEEAVANGVRELTTAQAGLIEARASLDALADGFADILDNANKYLKDHYKLPIKTLPMA